MAAPVQETIKSRKAQNYNILDSHNWLIHLYYTRKEFAICKELISKELANSQGMGQYPNLMQGVILRQEGKMQESLDYFQACQTYNPGHVENLKQIAKSWLLAGRHDAAMETYIEIEKALKKPDWEICHNLGMCYYYLKQNDKAKEYFKKAINLSNQSQSYIMLKILYLHNDDVFGAIEIFKAAAESSLENPVINLTLGLLYTRAGQPLQAFEKLGSTLAHDSHCAAALLAAGYIMQERQDLNVALAKYRSAAHFIPESAALWNNIGMCYLKKQKYVAAVCCLKRANYLAPFDSKILYNLGMVHLVIQQYASAYHFLSAWIHQSPYRSQAFMLLAVVLRHLDALESAKSAMEQACKLDTKNPLLPLNHAIFIYATTKHAPSVAAQLKDFDMRAKAFQITSGNFVDDELFIIAKQLTSQLELGDKK